VIDVGRSKEMVAGMVSDGGIGFTSDTIAMRGEILIWQTVQARLRFEHCSDVFAA